MKDILDKRLLLFMGIAFFLPLGALYLHGLTENNTAQFVLYGIEAAAPSIAAMVVVISEGETASFLRGSFKRSGIIKALILPFGIVFLTMFLTKGISCFLLKEPFSGVYGIITIFCLAECRRRWYGLPSGVLRRATFMITCFM